LREKPDEVNDQPSIYPAITPFEKRDLLVCWVDHDFRGGRFSKPEDWKIGGGKRCLMDYPAQSRLPGEGAYANCQD